MCTVLFYAIDMDVVSLFENLSFLFLSILNLYLYCIDILYQLKCIYIVYLFFFDFIPFQFESWK